MQVRRQLPARSPLPFGAILAALRRGRRHDARAELAALLERELGAERATLFGSGTQALTAAIRTALASARNRRRLVALPGYSCYDIATAALGTDTEIALYDVDPETLQPDWESLERVFEAGASVAVLAYLYGVPIDWERAGRLARDHGVWLIEDAAQGLGGSYKGRPLGSLGPQSVVSFGRGKGWTGGSGGALLSRDGSLAEVKAEGSAARTGPLLAGTVAQAVLGRPTWYGIPHAIPWLHLGETRFHAPGPLRDLSPFSAALLLQTAKAAHAEAAVRRRNAEEWRQTLAEIPDLQPLPIEITAAAEAGFLRLPVLLGQRRAAAADIAALGRYGIERGYPTTPDHLPELRARLAADATQPLPGGQRLADQLLTFPTHGWTTPADLRSAGSSLRAART